MNTSITNGQRKQIVQFGTNAVEKILDKLGLDKAGAQRVIEHGDEFARVIREASMTSLKDLSVTDKYKDEEVNSSYTYTKEYKGPKPINDQIEAIAEIFGLDQSHALEFAKNLPELPVGAEGWFAIPSNIGLQKLFPQITDPAERYCSGVQLVHTKIASSRSFYNHREGQITPAQLRVHTRTAQALDLIAENQPGDILIVAGQLGMRHRGRSVRRAREVFVSNEFGLGSLAVGSIVLTHPERLVRWEELEMDCSGDEFSSGADGSFSRAPVFFFNVGGVGFGAYGVVLAYDDDGSASGFVPQ
ncbi:hypothetical protein KKC45_02275 [Patescibacteria group bacterium]|nr:hypothetical protein [Patescibacteria group bacterium]